LPKLKTGKEVYPSWIDLFNYLKFIINDDKAKELCEFILENREIVEKENIRLKLHKK
jgi:hypothetical protein